MKHLIEKVTFGLIMLSVISCQNKKDIRNAESLFYTDSIYSKNLSEYRKHNVYLPKEFDIDKSYPIIYSTDGSALKQKNTHKELLDSLIDNHLIRPVIFIASHANQKIADSTSSTYGNGKKVYLNYRNFEYANRNPLRAEDSLLVNRFRNHMLYFKDELIGKIESEFNQVPGKENRYFYGVSNGAGFGISLLNQYPNLIGTYLCFSTFGGDIQTALWKKDVDYPDLYLQYGSDEPFFLKEDAEFLKSKYIELGHFIETKAFIGGHDNQKWDENFAETLGRILKVQ